VCLNYRACTDDNSFFIVDGIDDSAAFSVSANQGIVSMRSDEDEILASLSQLRPEVNYSASSDFVADGLLDSLDIVSLVTDLEKTLRIQIDGIEILPENFENVPAIASLVRRSEKRA
jgi:acyl carrier protein